MITVIVALVTFGVGVFAGYKYGHSVATKAAAEVQRLKEAAQVARKAL